MSFFISYKSEDRDFALELKSLIEEAGFPVWMDVDKIRGGDEWKLVIDRAIEESLAVIVIVTIEALRSQYVTYEWSYAKGLKKPVLPVIREFPDHNNETHPKIHPRLDDIQHRRFTDESDPSNYEREKLLDDLRAIKQATEVPDEVQNAANMMFDPDPQRVDMGIHKLLDIDHPSAMEKLAEAVINNYDDTVKAKAGLALARKSDFKDERAIPGLEIALTTHPSNAQRALKALKQINTEPAVDVLVKALELPDSQLRIRRKAIIEAISEMNQDFALTVLRQIVRSSKIGDHVNTHALQALARLQDQEIIPDLIERITVHDATRYNVQVIQVLGEIGNAEAIQPILDVLNDNELRRNSNQQQIVDVAIIALSKIGGRAVLQSLQQINQSRVWASHSSLLRQKINELEQQFQDSS